MKFTQALGWVVAAAIAVSLLRLAFFPSARPMGIVPAAYAQGSVIEWKNSPRIVTAGNDGASTYVWDYDEKTKVRKYSVRNGKLTLETFKLEE
jgi:hypothetical protein